jgi:arabinose-5-phosphate isomerase
LILNADFLQLFDLQANAILSTRDKIALLLPQALEILKHCTGKIVVTGVGKSGIIGQKISATLASTGSPSVFINANEALHGDLGVISNGDVVLMLSKSGTTMELIKMLPKIKASKIPTLGIFGKTDTHLAQQLDLVLDASVVSEGSPFNLAPMASTTVALVIGDCLAAALMQVKGLDQNDFASNHPAGQLGRNLLLKAEDIMHKGENMAVCLPENSIKEAIVLLTKKNLGGLCVLDPDGFLQGFLTDGDIRKYLSQADDLHVSVREIMTRNPICLEPAMTLGQVLDIMERPGRQIYVAPVVDPNTQKAIGILRMHDILHQP